MAAKSYENAIHVEGIEMRFGNVGALAIRQAEYIAEKMHGNEI